MKKMGWINRSILFSIIVLSAILPVAYGQGTYYANSCAYVDVNDCINGSGVNTCHSGSLTGQQATHRAVDGDTVIMPTCTNTTPNPLVGNTWGDQTTARVQKLTINAGITLKGQDSPGGNQGGTGQTVLIQNNYGQCNNGGPFPLIQFNGHGTAAGRLTGFTIRANDSDTGLCSGLLYISTGSHAIRIDHIEIDTDQAAGSSGCDTDKRWDGIVIGGDTWGVIDHYLFNTCRRRGIFGLQVSFGGGTNADKSWALADSMGMPGFPANGYNAPTDTVQAAMVFEDNTINQLVSNTGSNSIACEQGARCVSRFNNVQSVGQHGLEQAAQGLRHLEVYGNTFTLPTYAPTGGSCGGSITQTCNNAVAVANRGGIGMYFENSITNSIYTYGLVVSVDGLRCNSGANCRTFSPWGKCNGTSNWDYIVGFPSTNPAPTPCINQIGRGKGLLINRSSPAWPNEHLNGSYYYANKMNGTTDPPSGVGTNGGTLGNPTQIFANLDYYYGTTSFTGATGVGYGTLANIPSSCTISTAKDGQTSGVGYWATDQGNWNHSGRTLPDGTSQGVLYTCSATNTGGAGGLSCVAAGSKFWCPYYEPFTYPHPLLSNGPNVTLNPNSLTFSQQVIGTTSIPKTFTLTNNGPGALTITTIATNGDFAQTNNCPISPSTLAANNICTFSVTFTPTAIETRSGNVTITDNGANSPQIESLTGGRN